MKSGKRWLGTAIAVALAASGALLSTPEAVASGCPKAPCAPSGSGKLPGSVNLAPKVVRTGKAPTGYEVTFKYYAPSATLVVIRGEWGLRSVEDATIRPPSQYRPGDFFGAALTNDMTLDPGTGVWSFTTPLPPGTWSYQFQVTPVADPAYPSVQDPANPTFNQKGEITYGSYEPLSQIYVPQDRRFSPDGRSLQAPALRQGELTTIRYDSPGAVPCDRPTYCTSPADKHDIAVYTPPGYNPNRKVPYPTLYLSHGGGGSEIDWFTQGAAATIIDNLIAAKTLQPTVVVTTDFNGLSYEGSDEEGYSRDLINNVIPLIEAKYNVSTKGNDRAFGGLSAGGGRGGNLLFKYSETFGYYGIWSSTGAFAPTVDMSAPEARTRLALHVGIGTQDPGVARHEGLDRLAASDIPFLRDDVNGVHSWDVWRQLLGIFAGKVAFAHTTTTVAQGFWGQPVATVVPSTTSVVKPTGAVQFLVGGKLLGTARLVNGKAALRLPSSQLGQLSNGAIKAVYLGDNYFASSAGSAAAKKA